MVLWTAPSFDGGAPITSYTATSDPDGRTCTPADDAATACTVTGLTNGTAYTFTVTADNEAGTSAASQLSAAATPSGAPGSPERADRGVRRPGGGRVVDRAGRYGRTTDHQLRGDGVAGGGARASPRPRPPARSWACSGAEPTWFTVTATNEAGRVSAGSAPSTE